MWRPRATMRVPARTGRARPPMTQGSETTGETSEKLHAELRELMRQHEQYSMALDAAMDPRTSLRLQRTLERLDEEIEGLQEALRSYEERTGPGPGTGEPPPGSAMGAVMPEWGEEEEPATSIYDPEQGFGPDPRSLAEAGFGGAPAQRPSPGAVEQPAMYGDSVPTQPTRKENGADPQASKHTTRLSESVRMAVTPGPDLGEEPPTTIVTPADAEPAAAVSASRLRDVMTDVSTPGHRTGDLQLGLEQDFEEMSTLVGEELEEPRWGLTEIVPPSPSERVGPTGPHAAVPQGHHAGPPPGQPPTPGAPPFPSGSADNSPVSPFGTTDGPSTVPTPLPYGTSSPFGTQPGSFDYESSAAEPDSEEWSMASRVILAVVVLAFLGIAYWILGSGP